MPRQYGTAGWPKWTLKTLLSLDTFTNIWMFLDGRLAALEDRVIDWQVQTTALVTLGLQRINDILGPALARINTAAELGFLVANSTTTATLAVSVPVTFTIADNQKDIFAPTPYLEINRAGGSIGEVAFASLDSYDRNSGALQVTPYSIGTLSGAHSDWVISAAASIWGRTGDNIVAILGARATADADAATASAAAAAASATAAATFDPSSYYDKTTVDGKFTALLGGVDSGHDTLVEIAADIATRAAASTVATNTSAIATNTAAITALQAARLQPTVLVSAGGHTCASFEQCRVDLTSGALSVALPATPADNDPVKFFPRNMSGANILTITRNGKTIEGSATDLTVDLKIDSVTLRYSNAATTWLVE